DGECRRALHDRRSPRRDSPRAVGRGTPLIPNPTLSPPGPPRLSLRGLGLIFLSFLFVTGFLMRAQPQWTDSVGRELSGLFSTSRHGGERNPSTSLETITSAQADFRANDRDGDGINQFWRGDIAGLYALIPRN